MVATARDLEGRTPKKCPVRQEKKNRSRANQKKPGTFFEVSLGLGPQAQDLERFVLKM